MKRSLRILRALGIGVAALAVIGLAVVYGISHRQLSRSHTDVPLSTFRAPAGDAVLAAEGERLARTRGCFGCHGGELEGRVFMDEPWVARIVAPALAPIAARYSDAELERVIRRGVRRDGRAVWVMASNMYYHLSDEDLAAIVAYLRTLPPGEGPATEVEVRLLGRLGAVLGLVPPITSMIDQAAPRMAVEKADPVAFGRYVATTSCTECHGADLEGRGDTPDLRIAAAYSAEQFAGLMRTGVRLSGEDTGFMSDVARGRFSHFTDEEVAALHA